MPGSPGRVHGPDGTPAPKRRKKTQLACAPCRARKTGCDGHRPHCRPCVSRGWQDKCQYPESVTGSRALTLVGIEKRLVSLEAKDYTAPPDGNAGHSATTLSREDEASTLSPQRFVTAPTQRDESTVDEGAHFGTSSNSEFIRDVHNVAANTNNSTDLLNEINRRSASRRQAAPCDLKDLILPPRRLADELLQTYLDLIQPVTPLLHRPTLLQQFHNLWEPASSTVQEAGSDEAVLYATMNMVFALGCQRNESFELEKRVHLGEEFYERSRKLISLELLDSYSLAVVQLLLLRAIWLFYTPHAERCWSVVSVAVRAAQAIGLDSSKLIHQRTSQLTREMRRRVWYVCIMLDRIASSTFARPLLLPRDTKVPLFAEIDDENLSSDVDREGQQENHPSRLTYNRLSLEAYKFGDKAAELRHGYTERGASMYNTAELGALADICQSVDDFEANLPPFLQNRTDKPIQYLRLQRCFELQKRNMCARLKYLKLWILRPILLQEVARETQQQTASVGAAETSRDHLARSLCRLCVHTAYEVLAELHVALSGSLRTSPWHALFFTFAAGSILIAATLIVELDVDLEAGSGKASWEQVCELFRFHTRHTSSAEHGISLLDKFRASIARRTGPPEQPISTSATTIVEDGFFQVDWQQPWDFGTEDLMSLDTSWFISQDFIF
ncbi:uncharacterized protein E0L32_011601 [Thyridium curvatum]|uniref:Zn(2)-C6 fungal-type domain-containing protein n=1 Tax=Thyridium curvatum TaxID=1093900 RepID=A0A507BNW6_9PEZI|nr:uncharacterized protein E0L32_011601 [Thyridium curvatum]TPX18488.1 hypothetical protein E0L32_011601 [Thyridium curvatum]